MLGCNKRESAAIECEPLNLRNANVPNARSYTHEEVMQAMQERIDRARDKPR